MSDNRKSILEELNTLQSRVDSLRVMLRQEQISEDLPDGLLSWFICETDGDTVGIPLYNVSEVLHRCLLVPILDAPTWVAGLLNLGGVMIPVLDLNTRIKGVPHAQALSDLIVICSAQGDRVGLIVSEAVGVHENTKTDIQPVSAQIAQSPALLGVTESDARTILLLSVPNLISTSHIPTVRE